MDNSSDEEPHSWAKKPRERIFPDNMSSSDNINSDSKQGSDAINQSSSQINSKDEYTPGRGGRRGNARSAGKSLSISQELAFINSKYKSILQSQEERILYRPVKAYKLKPKNVLRMFQAKWRYIMFTNRRLYTLQSEAYEEGSLMNAERLIANKIDIDFLSHLIFIPKFIFDSYEMFDVGKLKNDNTKRRSALVKEMKQKRCKIIIGFKQAGMSSHYKFNESDIALETTMWTVLQLIHSCQLVNMIDLSSEFSSQISNAVNNFEKQRTLRNNKPRRSDQQTPNGDVRISRQLTMDNQADKSKLLNRSRGSKLSNYNKVDQIQYFPVFMVKNKKYSSDAFDERQSYVVAPRSNSRDRKSSRSKSGLRSSLTRCFSGDNEHYNLKQFYRAKNSDAEIKIGDNPEILQRVDTKYYCDLFWALEPQSQPEFIKAHADLELQIQQQKADQTVDSQNVEIDKNNQTGVFGQSPLPFSNFSTNHHTAQLSGSNMNQLASSAGREGSKDNTDGQISRNRASIKTQQKAPHLQSNLLGGNSLDRNMSQAESNHKRFQCNLANMAASVTQHNVSNSIPRTEKDHSGKHSKQTYLIPYFNLEEIRSHKAYIQPGGLLKHDMEVQKCKIYKPFIIQNQVQLEFRNGDFMYLGTRISRPLQDVNSMQTQQLIYEKSQIFDEELIDIFPVLSQPKVFLREQISYEQNKSPVLHHTQLTPQPIIQHSLYFGFLIPKFKKTMPLDLNNLNNYIGFKHGLMLLHQFLDFMLRIHKKDHKFGHFDLSNLYFVENRGDQNNQINQYLQYQQSSNRRNGKNRPTNESEASSLKRSAAGSTNSKSKKPIRFTLELLFIEKNLQNLAILQNNEVLNQSYLNRYISQVTEQEQEQFVNESIFQDFFCINETMMTRGRERDRSKSRENRWSAKSANNDRSKSDNRSISQHVIDQFKQDIKELQMKIDKMQPNFEKSHNRVEIETLQVFVQVLLQYCHRISSNQTSPQKRKESSNNKGSVRSPKHSIISDPTSQNEESFDFLRRKDDVMRQNFYYEFMNTFNQHQVTNFSPGQIQSDVQQLNQNSTVKISNSLISMPQSISNFEEKIFEKQLNDAKKICQNYIDLYENKQFWQNALAIYVEDSQNATGRQHIAENPGSPDQVEKQSFVSFSNYSRVTQSRALIAQSQQFPSTTQNRYNSGSLCLKVKANKQKVQQHMKMLEDMMNMSNNFDNMHSPRSNNGGADSKHESKITSNKTQMSAESYVNQMSQVSNNNMLKFSYEKKRTLQKSPTNNNLMSDEKHTRNHSLVSMQFENYGSKDSGKDGRDVSESASPQRYRSPAQKTVTPKAAMQKIIPRQNQFKNNTQRVDKVSCVEGLDSIVSGVGSRGELSYINFANQQRLGSKAGFGTLSGIGGAGDEYRNSIRKSALQKVQQANEKLLKSGVNKGAAAQMDADRQVQLNNQRQNFGQNKNKDVKVAKPVGNFRDKKDSQNAAGMKYLTSVKQSKLEEEPISEDEDDDEDDVEQAKYIQKQKKIIKDMEIERQKQVIKGQNSSYNSKQVLKSNGIVQYVPQIKQKSKISSEGQNSSRVSRFGTSHVSQDKRGSRYGSSPSMSPDEKSRTKSSIQQKSTIYVRDNNQAKLRQSSVMVSSPAGARKSSIKLNGLKQRKNQQLRDDNKEYDDELDDHVDANDIFVQFNRKTTNQDKSLTGGSNSMKKELKYQDSPSRDQRSSDNDKQHIVGILKSSGRSRQEKGGHRFNTNNKSQIKEQNSTPQGYQERNKRANDELVAELQSKQHGSLRVQNQMPRNQGSMKLNSTQNFLGKALESQDDNQRKKSNHGSNKFSSTHYRTEQKTNDNRSSMGQSSQSQQSNFKQRQFNLQQSSTHRGTGSTYTGGDQMPRKSFRGYKQQNY